MFQTKQWTLLISTVTKHGVSYTVPEANDNPLDGNRQCCPVTPKKKKLKGRLLEIFSDWHTFVQKSLPILWPTMQDKRFSPGYNNNLSKAPPKQMILLKMPSHITRCLSPAPHIVVLYHTLLISHAYSSFHRWTVDSDLSGFKDCSAASTVRILYSAVTSYVRMNAFLNTSR